MAERQQRRRKFLVSWPTGSTRRASAAVPAKTEDAGAGAMPVGRELRAAREKLGWSLEDLETSLKIRFSVLQAIEGSRFDLLPGSAYAFGFVRAYARFLRLDAEEMVRRYKAEAGAFGTPAELSFPSPEYESRLPRDVVIIVSIIVAAVAYGAWYYTTATDRAPIPRVAAVPEQLAALATRPPETTASPSQAEAATNRLPVPEPAPAMSDAGAPPVGVIEPRTAVTTRVEPPPPAAAALPPMQVVEVPVRPVAPAAPLQAPAQAGRNAPTPTAQVAPQPVRVPQPPAPSPAPRAAPPVIAQAPAAPPTPAPVIAPVQPAVVAAAPAPRAAAGAPPPPPPSLIFGGNPPPTAAAPAPVVPAPTAAPAQETGSRVTLTPPSSARAVEPAARVAAGDSRITIRAVADVWVEVRDPTGKPVYMKLMHRGDSYSVPNRAGLTLSSGRASALTMTVDGEAIDVQRRNLNLDADELKAGRRAGG